MKARLVMSEAEEGHLVSSVAPSVRHHSLSWLPSEALTSVLARWASRRMRPAKGRHSARCLS